MKYLKVFALTICIGINFAKAQVQKWENWQSNLFVTTGGISSQPHERNIGVNLWGDRGFGMELHHRDAVYGTALYTRDSHEPIWLGSYGSNTTQQQQYIPWMTLVHGRVGIGTTPDTKLDLLTSSSLDGFRITHSVNQGFINFQSSSLHQNAYNDLTQNEDAGIVFGSRNGIGQGTFGFIIAPHRSGTSGLRIDNQGNVGIATANTYGYKLAVNGNVICEKVVVKQKNNWPDYVFNSDHQLPSLTELEQYIRQHRHLPDVPSAEEVGKNGLDLGENQAALLKKIEELTLYVIEQNKKLEEQQKELNAVKQQLSTLTK
jgi:hypothetical protein